MFLTPKDIHDKTFKRSFKGYDENEVDEFLDLIIKEFNMLIDENERLRQELTAKPLSQDYSSASLNEIMRLEGMLKQIMDTIQRNAEYAVQNTYQEKAVIEVPPKIDEEAAAVLAQKAKLEEFKKALDSSKSNFELLIEEQRKQLNEKYSEIIGDLSIITPNPTSGGLTPQEAQIPDKAEPVPATTDMSAVLTGENKNSEPAKPQFLAKPPVQMTETGNMQSQPAAIVAERPQQYAAQQPLYTPPPVAQQPLNTSPQPVGQQPLYTPAEQPYQQPAADIKPQFIQRQVPQGAGEQPVVHPGITRNEPETAGTGLSIKRDSGEQKNMLHSDNRFKPNYSEYEWLYKEKDLGDTDLNTETAANFDITFRNPREKEELKRLIDEVID